MIVLLRPPLKICNVRTAEFVLTLRTAKHLGRHHSILEHSRRDTLEVWNGPLKLEQLNILPLPEPA